MDTFPSNCWHKKPNEFRRDPCLLASSPEQLDSLLDMFIAFLPLVLASTSFATLLPRQNTRQYTVYNKCPMPIDLYISGAKEGTIPTGGNVVKTLGTGAGYFFTDANGGSQNAYGTIHAGFYDVRPNSLSCSSLKWTIPQDYYYIISDPKHANTGLQVKPKGRNPVCYFHELFPFTTLTIFVILGQWLL